MKKLINDLKHLVIPVNPVKNIKKQNEAKFYSPLWTLDSGLFVKTNPNFLPSLVSRLWTLDSF